MKRLQHSAKTNIESNKEAKKVSKKLSSNSSENSTKKSSFMPFLSLENSMKEENLKIFKNEKFVCIKDKYPKSKIHLLLIPIMNKIPKLLKIQDLIRLPNSIDLLKEMRSLSEKIINEKYQSQSISNFFIGFHSIQSMQPLHMHIISNDFQSDCLKNKKHWNSFNTKYFLKLNDLINHLEIDLNNLKESYFLTDKFNLDKSSILKEYLNSELKCNKCNQVLNNMPNLKKHLLTHS